MGYERQCISCNNTFTTDNFRQKKCHKDCGRIGKNRARSLSRLHNDLTFVGVDGEGVDRPNGAHEYVMLSVGNTTLWKNGRQLTLAETLGFLWDCFQQQPSAVYVGFFLGYDFIQWEKLLPEREARLLLTNEGILSRKTQRHSNPNPYPDPVVWEGWEIDIMAGRRFKLRPHIHHRSEWTSRCRNRTCERVFTEPTFASIGEPTGEIISGEMEFVPSDSLEGAVDYDGDPETFWRVFSSPVMTVGQGEQKSKAYSWMYICDTGAFWQTSFVNVIDPKGWNGEPVCTDEEFETVLKGKSERGNVYAEGDTSYFEEMRRYNILENDILARVTARLNQGFMNDRIPIKIPKTDWYGPGRAAQLWMDQLHALCSDESAREHNKRAARNKTQTGNTPLERKNETGILNLDVYMSMPTWFYEAAQASYYGGWFEQFMHGHVGDVWEYDINSAYPFIIASLPCLHTSGLHNGRYDSGEDSSYPKDGRRYTLLYGTVYGSDPYIGAMPYRTRMGLISRPSITKGWYWEHEIAAAKKAGLVSDIEIERWVSYLACDCPPPFNPETIGIEALYQLRLDFGKNTPQGKSAKLVYNSAYGKTAQSIGSPKYSNPVYASLITAGCRTLILKAIATHPLRSSGVAMVATDGIYFLEKHPSLDINPTVLGRWDETFKPQITQLMPGVYWDDNTRERVREGLSPKLKSRGVSARDLAKEIEKLDYLFGVAHQELSQGGEYLWPEIEFKTGFLLESAKMALNRSKWNEAGKVTHGAVRRISSNPKTKRVPVAYRDDAMGGITRTRPYQRFGELESTPYDKSFGYQSEEMITNMFGDMVDRDGEDGMQYWRDLING